MDASGTMCFHGIEYSVEIWVQSDELHVQVEEESVKPTADVDRWGGAFPAMCAILVDSKHETSSSRRH